MSDAIHVLLGLLERRPDAPVLPPSDAVLREHLDGPRTDPTTRERIRSALNRTGGAA